ncbi:hypothetical protein [Pseudobacillus wudalianchiensis]|uniref:DUF2188 domain-containing protein n=1 Tax=Pseudobacillus wudalianchiensis TaxID=1743143 RepID=A0A1B9AC27_9BACI|nr:hypothetical protein [Bacillus wudalianchiensis]OCA81389.1 hypothetical protein A8F95_16690 [Bacillus wudalianchiensis]
MPWTNQDYPDSMKNLPDKVREKAIEIANALLEEDYEEGKVIAIAIDRARSSVGKGHGNDEERPVYHLQPKESGEGWQLVKKETTHSILADQTKEGLSDKAKEYVKERDGILVVHHADGSEERRLYEN